MKTNDDYGGFLSFLKEEFYQTWVDYFIKFFDAYKNEGIENFWGLTTGNEPSLALLPLKKINSVAWTHTTQQKWIAENLGPTIRNSEYSHLKIMALDDQLFFLPWYIELVTIIVDANKFFRLLASDFLKSSLIFSESNNCQLFRFQ